MESPADWSIVVLPIILSWSVGSLGHSCQSFGTPSVQVFADNFIGIPVTQIATLDSTATSLVFSNSTLSGKLDKSSVV